MTALIGGEIYRMLHAQSRLREDATASRSIASSMRNCNPLGGHLEADDIGEVMLPELPQHGLLDARVLADLYSRLIASSNRGTQSGVSFLRLLLRLPRYYF